MATIRLAVIFGAIAALAPFAALGEPLPMLDQLQRGQWTVVSRDGGPDRSICLRDSAQLVQLRHGLVRDCSRYIVEESADLIAVQYTCRGKGYGRTSIRRETMDILQIESQGVVDGRPFQFSAEARRMGPCR